MVQAAWHGVFRIIVRMATTVALLSHICQPGNLTCFLGFGNCVSILFLLNVDIHVLILMNCYPYTGAGPGMLCQSNS